MAARERSVTHGWDAFDGLTALEDFNGDKIADLLARKPDGTLWFYPGTGTALRRAAKIGPGGWDAFDALISVRDFTGDGKNDLSPGSPMAPSGSTPAPAVVDAGDPAYTRRKRSEPSAGTRSPP